MQTTTKNLLSEEGETAKSGKESTDGEEQVADDHLNKEDNFASVPVVRVRLLQSVRVLPHQTRSVLVQVDAESCKGPLLLEYQSDVEEATGLQVEDALLSPAKGGVAKLVVANRSGFTQVAQEGADLGEATEVTLITPGETLVDAHARVVTGTQSESPGDRERERYQKLEAMLEGTDLLEPEKTQLVELLREHHNSFCLEDGERGETDLIELDIDTGDTTPKRQRVRRMPFAVRKEVARQLKIMQGTGVIQPSCSPWASAVVLVRKKDGSHRFCVDYRNLNSVTKLDSYPLPRIDDLLDQLDQSLYFSTLDLASGYWQIRVHRDSVPKTAFITPQGLFEFRVMPFGLTNAPSVFQRLMQRVLMVLIPQMALNLSQCTLTMC